MKPSPAINGRFYSSAGEPATGAQGCLTNVANVGAQAPEGDEQVHHLRDHVGRMSAANLAHQPVSVDVVTVPWPRFRGVLCLYRRRKGKVTCRRVHTTVKRLDGPPRNVTCVGYLGDRTG